MQFWIKIVKQMPDTASFPFAFIWDGPHDESMINAQMNFLATRLQQSGVSATLTVEPVKIV